MATMLETAFKKAKVFPSVKDACKGLDTPWETSDFEAMKGVIERMSRKYTLTDPDQVLDKRLYNLTCAMLRDSAATKPDNVEILGLLEKAVESKRLTKRFQDPSVTMASFQDFLSPSKASALWKREVKGAMATVESSLNIVTLEPIRVTEDTEFNELFSNDKASAGFFSPGSKKSSKSREILYQVRQFQFDIENDIKPREPYPCIAFKRCQISKMANGKTLTLHTIKYKQRFVWGYSSDMTGIEATVARPIINHFVKNVPWYAGGQSLEQIRAMIKSNRKTYDYWYSIDYSKYDSTVPNWLISAAFSIIKKFYVGNRLALETLDYVEDFFINTTVVLPDGGVYKKSKGIPSGSYFTQIIGSLCNAIMVNAYFQRCERVEKDFLLGNSAVVRRGLVQQHSQTSCSIMGDDNLFFTHKPVDMVEFADYLKRTFGVVIHPDKCAKGVSQKDDPEYLKRHWALEGAYRDALETLINMLYPEQWRKYDTYDPIMIIWSYWLGYPLTFDGLFEIEKTLEYSEDALKALEKSDSWVPSAALPSGMVVGQASTLVMKGSPMVKHWNEGYKRRLAVKPA
uniref:Putative RNA-dependent RNA polymerase n=1 Tax=Red panda associated partiti-like virus TaxID=2864003 RepID=A0A8K1M5A8_9VIRU|nr:putative RNA-dependent RNA polymerase [Red panda associated partiti-like virus]